MEVKRPHTHSRRIACVIHSLGPGGAERMLVTMANYWGRAGFDVHVVVLGSEAKPAFDLHESVSLHFLDSVGVSSGGWASIINNLKRIKAVRKVLKYLAPDVVLGFMDTTNVITILATAWLGGMVVATEHTDPAKWGIGRMWEVLRIMVYPFADVVTVQTESALSYYPAAINRKAIVLPNPVEVLPPSLKETVEVPTGPFVVGLGRLSKEKGFGRLIRAFSSIAEKHDDWTLVILGEGEERKRLTSLRDSLGLQDRILLPGFTPSPHDWLRKASLFVLSSRFEGFGNAIIEALLCGVPVVAVDCSGVVQSVVENGLNGLVVSNVGEAGLAEGIDILMTDSSLRLSMARHAAESVNEYALPAVMAKWEEVLGLTPQDKN